MEYIGPQGVTGFTPRDVKTFKLVQLGEIGAGKSCLAVAFVRGSFNIDTESTIACAFMTQTVCVNDQLVKYQIWDTAGQERYRTLAKLYYRGADAAIVVYDLTTRESFLRAKDWVKTLEVEVGPDIVVALAGSKADLESRREVETAEAQAYADQHNLIFMETSAKTFLNVKEIFMAITGKLLLRVNNESVARVSSKRQTVILCEEKQERRCPKC